MNNAIEAMLSRYSPTNNYERESAIKEILQEIALAGLSRGGFFEKAAFYGGTCLRIFHGLNRWSEDLDFALLSKDPDFKLDDYFPALEKEFKSYGIDISVETRKKDDDASVQSAFLKGNTMTLMMSFFPKSEDAKRVVSNQKTKIKFEIDTDNPSGGVTEFKYRMLPAPYEVQIFDESTLFAGKIHAIICRDYKHHVKGRDYYDYLLIGNDETLTLERVKGLLKERFEVVDYESAKKDVSRFIGDQESLTLWKKELFLSTLGELKGN